MSVGPAVRRMLGPVEAPISSAYRSMFVNIDELGNAINSVPFGPRILEVGVGDGMVVSRLVAHRPEATVLGIDLAESVGSLYEGDPARAEFRTQSTSDLLAEAPVPFDAVIIADVLHHVSIAERAALLSDASRLLSDDGVLFVKESCVTPSLGFWMGYCSDRWITGDRNVSFLREEEVHRLVRDNVEGVSLCGRFVIPPWKMNVLLAWKRAAA